MKNRKVNMALPQEVIDMLEELKNIMHISKTAIVTIALQEYYKNELKRKEAEK